MIENQKPVPHILPAPTKNRYDPIRDRWAKGDMDIYKHINTEAMFAIPDSMAGYKCFNLSETIQQKASEAAEEQDGCVPLDIPGVRIFRFDWTSYHDAVNSPVLGLLVRKPIVVQDQADL